ncbi:hypothetical protein [Rugamonas aquatica]|uniref:Uncharacterized protein n=1 Tax=Rugamonas aquatica TaxID=2743357 RepID=A0A6A7N773_9BURK|nr:hypothetical protein [Rugamonas aquatica]MQA40738.1 hypothetical protein [Rugamonas aquatica]
MSDPTITGDSRYVNLKQQWDDKIANYSKDDQAAYDKAKARYTELSGRDPATLTPDEQKELLNVQGQMQHYQTMLANDKVEMGVMTSQRDTELADLEKGLVTLRTGDTILAAVAKAAAGAVKQTDGMDVLMAAALVYRAAMDNSGAQLTLLRNDLQKINADLAGLTALQSGIHDQRPNGSATDTASLSGTLIEQLKTYGINPDYLGQPDKNGNYTVSQANFDKLKEDISGLSGTMTTKQSTVLADLQRYSNEYQVRSDTSTSLMKSEKDLLSSINRNLG